MLFAEARNGAAGLPLKIQAEIQLPSAEIFLLQMNHAAPDSHLVFHEDMFWIDLCLTPRRQACGRYVDRWGTHRYGNMGSIIALPPKFRINIKHAGGRHNSLICALKAEAVQQWLPPDFEWTDRRLEACLGISSAAIRNLLLRLAQELHHSGVGSGELYEAIVLLLSIEIARYLIAIDEPTERGGLADWRLRVIDKRLAESGSLPTLADLAQLCGISVRQLTRGVRTSRGCSIGDYMSQSRMDIAKRLLSSEETIKSVAGSMGFTSQSSFTYAFRRATGITPKEFRNRLLSSARGNSQSR
jgi:AraC family transcriptional regulator